MGFSRDWEVSLFVQGRPCETARTMLKAMSLVSRDWTKPAQNALRRRAFLDKNWQIIQRFLDSGMCGPWVRELQYWEDDAKHMQTNVPLAALIEKMPNLVALSIGSDQSLLYPTDVTRHLISLSSTPHLRALHIQCGFGLATLTRIYGAVSNLHKLETLSLMGEWMHEMHQESVAPEPFGSHPPASLKKLLFHVDLPTDSTPSPELFAWILQAREDYALGELRLVVRVNTPSPAPDAEIERYGPMLLKSLSDTLPLLKTLVLGCTGTFAGNLYREIVQKCMLLENLHLYDEPKFNLPASVKHLCWGHDIFQFNSVMDHEDELLSKYLQSQLASGKAPNLRSFHIINQMGIDLFPQTRKVCKEFGIKFNASCNLEWSWMQADLEELINAWREFLE